MIDTATGNKNMPLIHNYIQPGSLADFAERPLSYSEIVFVGESGIRLMRVAYV